MKFTRDASCLAVAYTSAVITLCNMLVIARVLQALREERDQ